MPFWFFSSAHMVHEAGCTSALSVIRRSREGRARVTGWIFGCIIRRSGRVVNQPTPNTESGGKPPFLKCNPCRLRFSGIVRGAAKPIKVPRLSIRRRVPASRSPCLFDADMMLEDTSGRVAAEGSTEMEVEALKARG